MKNLIPIRKSILTSLLLCVLLIFSQKLHAQEPKNFTSLNEVLELVKSNNYLFKNADFQTQLAELTKKTAFGNVINPRIPTSFQSIDNVNQQVSFLPGAAFGMPEGTFKEVTMGQQYISTLNIQPQFDLFNLSNISQIKTAKINMQLVENQNQINEQILFDKINVIYSNILSFNAQKEIIQENIIIAENIVKITESKFKEGISRKQELNEAEVNLINLQDKLEQIEMNIKIQHQSLNLFFENLITPTLLQSLWEFDKQDSILKTNNQLLVQNTSLQAKMAEQEYKMLKYQNVPVLSFTSNYNWQNLSNDRFFSTSSSWINYNYVGLKISYDLPTTVLKLSNSKSKKVQTEILKNNAEHSIKEAESKNNQLILEYEKAIKQKLNFQKIQELKKDTYEKNFNQYSENILPLDKLLISQNDLIMSKLNIVSALANIEFSKNRIEINNRY